MKLEYTYTTVSLYGRFRVFSPYCILRTVIIPVISVLERLSLTHNYAIRIHMRLHRSNTVIT